MEFSNVLDGSKPARTLLAALSVTLLASSELIDMVIYDLLKIMGDKHKLREPQVNLCSQNIIRNILGPPI